MVSGVAKLPVADLSFGCGLVLGRFGFGGWFGIVLAGWLRFWCGFCGFECGLWVGVVGFADWFCCLCIVVMILWVDLVLGCI